MPDKGKPISLGATTDVSRPEESQWLTVGEIDAKYIKLLRMRGETELANGYGLRKQFRDFDVEPGDTGEFGPASDGHEITDTKYGGLDITSGNVSQKPQRKGGFGTISRQILSPESPSKSQPIKRRKGEAGGELSSQAFMPSGVVMDPKEYESYVENALKNFLLYVAFLVIANIITFGVLDHAYNYYANVLSEIIVNTPFNTSIGITKKFDEIRNIPQIWAFVNGVLLKVLYEYGSDQTKSIRFSKRDDVMVLFENILIGVPRMRQQRVKNDSCYTPGVYRNIFDTCYSYYSDQEEDKEPFGIKLPRAWTYSEPDEDSSVYHGKISSYGGGGYMMNISKDAEYTTEWIKQLIEFRWISKGTRAVFIDFTTYTPNTNLFCVVKLVFELPPTGGVIPTSHFYTLKFLRYVNKWDHFVLGCEVIFLCFIVYFTMELIQQMIVSKEEYWYNSWNILDLIIIFVAYFVIGSACARYILIATGMKQKVSHIRTRSHASFDNFVRIQQIFNTSTAILSFLVWLKLLKFAALNKSVAIILSIFGRVKFELIALTLMMITMVLGFALLGNTLFGTHVEQFNTIWNSVFSLVGIFVGGLYFYIDCAEASPYLAPLYFILYIFLVLVLFLNAYVALIVHGFHKVVEEFEDQRDRIYLGDIARTLLYKLLRLCGKGSWAKALRNRRVANKNKKDYADFLVIVKKHGYRDVELDLLLKKHNVNPGGEVGLDKMSRCYNDIDAKARLFAEIEMHDSLIAQTEQLSKKVQVMDKSVADLYGKVDTLVQRNLYAEDQP